MGEPVTDDAVVLGDENVLIAPVLLIDGAQTIVANDHLVRFNLFQDRAVSSDGPVKRVVCTRLVMSHSTFQALASWLAANAADVAKAVAEKAKGG